VNTSISADSQQTERAAVFADFVREALTILLVTTLALVWAWTSFVGMFDPDRTPQGYLVLALTSVGSFAVYILARRRLHLAVSLYLLTLLVAIQIVVSAYADASLLTLYLLVVLVAAPLTAPRGLGVTTLLVLAVMVATGAQRGTQVAELVIPVMLTALTGLTAWLSTRRLFTALGWALTMTDKAMGSAEEARDHRLELQRVLHSLDLALSRLERNNRALAFAQEAAEQAYRFKSEFVANVSHELRTPLNLIVGFSEMMTTAPESYGGKPLPSEYRGDMLAIYRSSRHLLDLINDVLDLSQIEAGRMVIHKERVILVDVIREAADIVRGLAEARRLQLIVDEPPAALVIDLDRVRTRQVLLNLLTNAMRYTEQGWVRIDTEIAGDAVTIRVADSGRGIAPDKLQRAFEAFDRLDEEDLTHGSGLGLAVSKKFVELHEGRMWIASTPGQGTCVGFTLPLPSQTERLPLGALRLSAMTAPDRVRPSVLVIHDDLRTVALLRRYIEGYDFVLAENAAQMQARLAEQAPDAILVEPRTGAWWRDLVAATGENIPVVVAPLPGAHHASAVLGATDFLPKPVTRDDLAFVLERLHCQPRTALVIDDDPHIVRLIGRMLRSLAPEVHTLEAFDGAAGLVIAQTHTPDVIFVDLNMPGMSGQQFIEAVNADPALAGAPIVVVSVRSTEQESAPIQGEVHIQRGQGFALSELLALLETTLTGLTRPGAVSPTSAAARLAALAG
jgi:signal transduction histidine kinase/DNA-binding response OmpR family regulator